MKKFLFIFTAATSLLFFVQCDKKSDSSSQTYEFSIETYTNPTDPNFLKVNFEDGSAVRFLQIPSNLGIGLELKVIAAAVVGGVAISGGRGTIAGTMLGMVLLGVIGPALTFLGFSAYWERAIEGGIILAAVSMDAVRVRSGKHADIVVAQRA